MKQTAVRWCIAAACVMGAAAVTQAATVTTLSPQGTVAKVRQVRITFSDAMVRFGDPRLPAPATVACRNDQPVPGTGRWVDDKTWVHDFNSDVPAGTRCEVSMAPGLKALAGDAVTGVQRHAFNTGGPTVVRAWPEEGQYTDIEEEQVFALLLNGPATKASIEKHAHCEAAGIVERVPVAVVEGPTRADIIQTLNLTARQARVVTLRCARPLPPESTVNLVWGTGIATPSGVANTERITLDYRVRPAFKATFSCERVNARAGCLPIRPLRLEFSSPVPRRLAEQIVLRTPDGTRQPVIDTGDEEPPQERLFTSLVGGVQRWFYTLTGKGKPGVNPGDAAVSAVVFKPPFAENAELTIELPAGFKDDAGRVPSNASTFPLKTRTADAPPLLKFPRATFGVIELNADPTLPVTVRHVEGQLATKGLKVGPTAQPRMRDLQLSRDADIIEWLAKVKQYDERRLSRQLVEQQLGISVPREKPADPDDESDTVQTRAVSLLNRERHATTLALPAVQQTDPHPFEVVGIPMPTPGFHVVEVASPRLGQALLDKQAPMYVRTSVLVTNLGVHVKVGAVNSLVWVTTLDKARPVPDAQVQVSDCRGKPVWQGRTDKRGLARIDQALPRLEWQYCRDDTLDREEGYFVSARKTDDQGRADMAFVWSSWNQGIESWRFPFASSDQDQTESVRFHTVMDRTLLRAGQTVSMRHHARAEMLKGLRLLTSQELPTRLRIVHEGSDQTFELDLSWQQQRHADTTFALPEDAKLGRYRVEIDTGQGAVETGSFRVEAFRLPVLSGRMTGPKGALVQPKDVPVGLQVNYTNGGGAARLPVRVSAQFNSMDVDTVLRTSRFPGFTFRQPRALDDNADHGYDAYVDEDDGSSAMHTKDGSARLVADKLAVTLDAKGAGQVTLSKLPEVSEPRELLVQATYADPNGEVQTLSQTLPVWPSALVLGMRTDSWVSVKQKVATQVMVLDTAGKPQAGVKVSVHAIKHSTQSNRKRLVGGFYAYDNQHQRDDLGQVCQGTSDARGLVWCETRLDQSGEMELVARAADSQGHEAQAAASVWVTRQGELWFGGDNQDRMDVIPERRSYEAGQVARLQVRSPFRHATALVAVERNGIIDTFTVELHGEDPTIEVPIQAEWAPNVYVSVLAVRGRVLEVPWYSFFTWGWKTPKAWWQAWRDSSQQYQEPTAMVDLSKPAFKYGVAEIEVGMAAHTLKVEVLPDRSTYPIRATSQVKLRVRMPDGTPAPAGTQVSLAAVDEALLQLKGNDSWDLLGAMIKPRGYGVETATAQMQIIGKRHYGRKAVPAGGGGGAFAARELFDTLLLWQGGVVLDARGEAVVKVPLNDSLTAFRIVAVADVVKGQQAAWFGTGQATITATQDLQILSGVPPLVREGDAYRAMFTVRNATARPMAVVLQGRVVGVNVYAATLPSLRVQLPANAASEVGWDITVPYGVKQLSWEVQGQAAGVEGGSAPAQDRMAFTQQVAEAQPVTVQQATLVQLDKPLQMPVAVPARALPNGQGGWRGGIDVALSPSLASGLDGVRGYFLRYPWSCLEQKTSIAIGTRDIAYWQSIARQIPLYLDADGLVNYFPPSAGDAHGGSDSLTAYLLSITDEASLLGYNFHIPDDTRERMARGLIDFVEGRIQREFWAPSSLKNGDLDVRKLAALEALSRLGKARASMADSLQITPNQWPTAAVIDWMLVLDRVKDMPERARRLQEAEQILRARLNVQGTRLGFSTERDDNWWWLMANGDVNSVRMLLGVLDRPAWKPDAPRLVTGALQRQQRGHWSTTVANAWGSVAVEAFSRRFEQDPVAGTTRATQGEAAQVLNWSAKASGGTLTLPWPATPGQVREVRVAHEGTGKPWVTFTSKAAVPLQAPFSSGYRIRKTITPVEQKTQGVYSRGDVLRIRLDIDVQADATWVVLNDPVPGGATILGSGLGRDSVMDTASEQSDDRGWLAYQERTFEAFRAYYRYLPKGNFQVEYTVRLNNPGTFGLPATRVEAMYAPEMFGEWPNAAVVVKP